MSAANKCDLCGALFEPAGQCVQLDVRVRNTDNDTWLEWSDIDLCAECGDKVHAVIAPAIADVCPS